MVATAAAVVVWSALAGCAGSVADTGAGGSTGTGGSGGSPCVPSGPTTTDAGIAASFDTVKLVLGGGGAITPCASAPCHAVGGMAPPPPEKPLTLQNNADLYTNMMSYVSVQCGNIKLIEPGKPDQSALIKILSGPCGVAPRMPYQCTTDACIPDDYIAALSQWIANCAPQQ